MKSSKLLILVFSAIVFLIPIQLAWGCVPQSSNISSQLSGDFSEASLNSPFELIINQLVVIRSEQIEIRFLQVTEDSRCPSESFCKWEGQVTIGLAILMDKQNLHYLSLTGRTDHKELAVKEVDGYVIELQKVDPYPTTIQELESPNYVITLVISKSGVVQ